jgi:hypothetical protein
MARDSIFITGWEYNRLLNRNAFTASQSALPGSAIWDGGAHFWLYKHVWCTEESFQGERESTEAIGHVQGEIYGWLLQKGFLKTYQWSKLEDDAPALFNRVVRVHKELRRTLGTKAAAVQKLSRMIREGKEHDLETLKIRLMEPILDHLRCAYFATPASIHHWMQKPLPTRRKEDAGKALRALSAPLQTESVHKLGVSLCRRPSEVATMAEYCEQKRIEQEVEKELVPDLLLNRISIKEYNAVRLPHREVYDAISDKMRAHWFANRDRILRLRDLAEQHLWKDLHTDWLPRLEAEPAFEAEFLSLIKRAVRASKMSNLLDLFTQIGICSVGAFAGYVGERLGMSGGITGAVAAGTGYALRNKAKEKNAEIGGLTVFYQRARELNGTQPQ